VAFLIFDIKVYRNKPSVNYFFLEAVGVVFFAGAFLGAGLDLLFDLAVAIIVCFKNIVNVHHRLFRDTFIGNNLTKNLCFF
jgi:hypothetical protein